MSNKKKIINDPVYGFIRIPYESCYDVIQHPWFQRLRRIRQLGVTEFVYPGATHSRFHHALGAMHLVNKAIESLRTKGVDISEEDSEATHLAILLHDIGHGPFSHALEKTLLPFHHEEVSLMFMKEMNDQMGGKLYNAIDIFTGNHPKAFLSELISGQLDMDRLDYLGRDSFYTGVSEGIVGSERILNMLNVANNHLVVEEKGIYSVEKFIIARRLMYWQVYLHKTVIAADVLLLNILKRANELARINHFGEITPAFSRFLNHPPKEFTTDVLNDFSLLDDYDIWTAIKIWSVESKDEILKLLSAWFIQRNLPKILVTTSPVSAKDFKAYKSIWKEKGYSEAETDFFVNQGELENSAYKSEGRGIGILKKDGTVVDLAEASDNYNLKPLKDIVKKYFLSRFD